MQTVHEKTAQLGGTFSIDNAMTGGTVACVRLPLRESVAAD
jgi:signal transduction histidine kinase